MKTEILTLTPEQAGVLLAADQTNSNRRFDKSNYTRFCALIKSGLWKTTHQGIAISADGRVVDGQHRLAAIRDCGVPVPVMVAWGADPSTFDCIDLGKGRTGNDIWNIAGFSSTNTAAIARLVWLYAKVRDKTDWHNSYKALGGSHAAVFNWAQECGYSESIAAGCRTEARVRKEIKGVGSAIGASVAIMEIYAGVPADEVFAMLYEPLMKCVGLREGTPVYVLHRILSRRDHRDARSAGNPFSTKIGITSNVTRARLVILLRVIVDTVAGKSRSQYPFNMAAPFPDLEGLPAEAVE